MKPVLHGEPGIRSEAALDVVVAGQQRFRRLSSLRGTGVRVLRVERA
jgi:hypothetical protein